MNGMMEREARRPFAVGDDAVAVARHLTASAVVNGLKHLFPVNVACAADALVVGDGGPGDPAVDDRGMLDSRTLRAGSPMRPARSWKARPRERDYAKLEAEVNAALG
jgi:hypothetical protein